MMTDFLKYLAEEWLTISQAPFIFLIIASFMFILAYFAAKWRYSTIIIESKAINETLNERLVQKSEQIEFYKERAVKLDRKVQDVVESDSASLKMQTLELVGKLREYNERYKRDDSRIMEQQLSDKTKEDNWSKMTNKMLWLSNERDLEYDRRFKVDAILLRDELRNRISNYNSENNRIDMMYEHPTNYFGLNDIASDLEKMAKKL